MGAGVVGRVVESGRAIGSVLTAEFQPVVGADNLHGAVFGCPNHARERQEISGVRNRMVGVDRQLAGDVCWSRTVLGRRFVGLSAADHVGLLLAVAATLWNGGTIGPRQRGNSHVDGDCAALVLVAPPCLDAGGCDRSTGSGIRIGLEAAGEEAIVSVSAVPRP